METQATYPGSAVFDYETLLKRCLGKHALVARLVVRFQESFRSDFLALERAAVVGDFEGLACVAHRIKGSSASMSTPRIRERAAETECLARAGSTAEIGRCVDDLRDEWTSFERSLQVLDLPCVTSWQDGAKPATAREHPCAC